MHDRLLTLLSMLLCASNPVSAMQVHAVHVSYRFHFPTVPYELGLRHIHTPEHIATTHRIGVPGFSILSTRPPVHTHNLTCIDFTCSALGFPERQVCMYTSARDRSSLMIRTPSAPLFLAAFQVSPLRRSHGHRYSRSAEHNEDAYVDYSGHTLDFNATVFTNLPNIAHALLPLLSTVNAAEDTIAWAYSCHEDENLAKYRRIVLNTEKY